ncbi:MAG: hypothetical protein R3246_08075, partial [Acidimicrobiia bacterium]|nr:hypothetical protein [Acidimicrobiia bacterium]
MAIAWLLVGALAVLVAIDRAPPAIADPVSETFETRVATGDDDVEELDTGRISRNSSDLELGENRGAQIVGLRFTGVTIPAGATITDAWIQFTVDEHESGTSDLEIRAELATDPQPFERTTGNLSSRATTSASVAWQPPEWPDIGTAGPDQQTPNLATVVDEVVGQAGWTSGASLVFLITGTGTRTAESYNGDAPNAPLFHVTYTTPGPANQPPVVTVSSPPDGSTVTEGDAVSFAASASDPEDGDLSAGLSWVSDLDGVIGSGGSFSTSALSVGTHVVTASVSDSGGLSGSDVVSVVVDPVPVNQAPSVSITSPPDGLVVIAGDSVSFVGSASDAEDGDLSASLSWVSDLDGVIGSGGSFSTSALSVGTHVVTASV